jgi:signal transduction histidine kinase
MSIPLILGCVWVIAAAVVAMLPMPRQMLPGTVLLIAAPVLLGWIGWVHGWAWFAVGLFALLSMFRRPLLYFGRRAVGLPAEVPPELRK